MSEGMWSEEGVADLALECGEGNVAVAGALAEAAVEGFRSWSGEGYRFTEAD